MSTRHPQEHEDLRWPHAQPDDIWPLDGKLPYPADPYPADPSPAASDGLGPNHAAPHREPAPGREQARPRPAQQAWDGGAAGHEDGWKSDPGASPGSDDDEDYEWIRYLGGGRSAQAKPSAAPPSRPARQGRGKPERSRRSSRTAQPRDNAPQRPVQAPGDADPGYGQRAYTDLGSAQPGNADPGSAPPGNAAPGFAPPGFAPPGTAPPGTAAPGFASPGTAATGFAPSGSARPGGGRGSHRGNGRAGNASPATRPVPGDRDDLEDGGFGNVADPSATVPELSKRQEPRARPPSRRPRREAKAREQDQREQQRLQQQQVEQERRELQRLQQKQLEQDQREQQRLQQKQLEQERREQQARVQEARERDQRERQQREQERRERDAREQAERKREAREQKARQQKQRPRKQRTPVQRTPEQRTPVQRTPERSQPTRSEAATEPVQSAQRIRSSRRSRRGLSRRILWLTAGALLVVVAVTAAVIKSGVRSGSATAHVLMTPPRLGAYARSQALAGAMDAQSLRNGIVRQSGGEAKNVVDAVYQQTAGPAAKTGPQIVLFIGGNLAGTSASAFITSFTGNLKGAVTISPGSLGGEAACLPGVKGRLSECAWADNDTFGVIASPTLSAAVLAGQLRQMRPLLERAAK
jgi:hypothetical protein